MHILGHTLNELMKQSDTSYSQSLIDLRNEMLTYLCDMLVHEIGFNSTKGLFTNESTLKPQSNAIYISPSSLRLGYTTLLAIINVMYPFFKLDLFMTHVKLFELLVIIQEF